MTNNNTTYEIKRYSSSDWDNILDLFDDANIYQTTAYTKHSVGGENSEQFILKINGDIVAAAQVRIKTVPILNRGIAYIYHGPLWIRNNKKDTTIFTIALQKLYEEYVMKRKLVLRINSNQFAEDEIDFRKIFYSAGFKSLGNEDKTIIVDITSDEETIKKGLKKKTRYNLKKSIKNDLTVEQGTSIEFYNTFLNLYKEMHNRKQFEEYVDVNNYKDIQLELNEKFKNIIMICKHKGEPVAALVSASIGKSGLTLLSASSLKGRDLLAAYLLQWEYFVYLKNKNFNVCDMGGIDKEKNPGGYSFKSGFGGKEVTFIGSFEAGKDYISKTIVTLIKYLKKK